MSSLGIEFFNRQRSTIDFTYATHIGVGWAKDYAKKHEDTEEIFTSIYPDFESDEYIRSYPHRYLYDLKEVAENLSLYNHAGISYNTMGVVGGEYTVLIHYLGGEPYYLCYADPLIIYTMGGNRFYPPANRVTKVIKGWLEEFIVSNDVYSGRLVILNNYPVVIYPLKSKRDETDQSELKKRLSASGYHPSFLGDISTANSHYNYPVRPKGVADLSTAPEPEYKMQGNMSADQEKKITDISRILEKCIPNISSYVKRRFRVKGLAQEDRDETVAYDLIFRILDVAVGLIVRGIDFKINHDYILATLYEIHILFILNMPDPQGRLPFSYPRRPLSYYSNSMREIRELWISLTNPFQNQKYQDRYDMMSGRYGSLRTGHASPDKIITLGTLVGDATALQRIRQSESLKRLPNLELVNKRLHYVHFYRDPMMREKGVSYWNIRNVKITEADVIVIPRSELEARGYKESEVLGTDYNMPYRTYESSNTVIVLRKDISIPELLARDFEGRRGKLDWYIYVQPQEEAPLRHFRLKHKYISINGIRFNSRDILLLYNTALVDILLLQDEQDIELPNADSQDLRLLQSLFSGRISMMYFYENASKYTYSMLSGKRTMLELFDMLIARDKIIKGYIVGTPLREQLSRIRNSIQDTPPRLGELIELAEIASS